MVTIDDMNIATGIFILIVINAIISSPLALIIAGITYTFKKKQGYTFGEIFEPTIVISVGVLTTASVIYIIIMYFKG